MIRAWRVFQILWIRAVKGCGSEACATTISGKYAIPKLVDTLQEEVVAKGRVSNGMLDLHHRRRIRLYRRVARGWNRLEMLSLITA